MDIIDSFCGKTFRKYKKISVEKDSVSFTRRAVAWGSCLWHQAHAFDYMENLDF